VRPMKVFNVFGNRYSGAWRTSFVAVVSRGTNYLREYRSSGMSRFQAAQTVQPRCAADERL